MNAAKRWIIKPRHLYVVAPVILILLFASSFTRFSEKRSRLLAEEAATKASIEIREREAQLNIEKELEEQAKRLEQAKAQRLKEKEEAERIEQEQRFATQNQKLQTTLEELNKLNSRIQKLQQSVEKEKSLRMEAADKGFALGMKVEELRSKKMTLDLENQRLLGRIMNDFEADWKHLTMVADEEPGS